MTNSYRIRTQVGVDKAVNVLLEQDFESLEILSLKILQNQIYTRQCSDYGVVVGRISANNGFGLPNAKLSIFIPLSDDDEINPIISELYPYKTLNDLNEDGYRYNLLPYEVSHGGHTPTGTFPSREDVLINPSLIEVFDKYYKYTAKTNDSGDFMIFGVPVGAQVLHIDIDLSDIGEFSLSPQDLIRLNLATENQVDGVKFRASTNLGELPQIKQANRTVEVVPLWGQPEICYLGITRVDFDLSQEFGIKIEPASAFMGSIFSNVDEKLVKRNCKTKKELGNMCSMVAGPGQILSIRQTIGIDYNGRPSLENFILENGGNCIDENGTWLIDLPMNLDYIYTSESGEQLISTDPSIGVPTKAKYRFKIKWQQPSTITGKILRGSYLVPNIKEWGWIGTSQQDPTVDPPSSFGEVFFGICKAPDTGFTSSYPYTLAKASYAFSLDWDDYGDGQYKDIMINEAIKCEDRFFEFKYNKVYTISGLITEFRSAKNNNYRYLAVKDILNSECESTTNTFPANDGQKNNDIIYLLFTYILGLLTPVLFQVIIIMHLISLLVCLVAWILGALKTVICGIANLLHTLGGIPLLGLAFDALAVPFDILCEPIQSAYDSVNGFCKNFGLQLPTFVYPDCEFCECGELNTEGEPTDLGSLGLPGLVEALQQAGGSNLLADFFSPTKWTCSRVPQVGQGSSADEFNNLNISIYLGALATGAPYIENSPSTTYHSPQMTTIISNDGDPGTDTGKVDEYKIFTTSLPYFERFNLFNTKAKYFATSALNPGSNINRIKVRFATDNPNNNINDYHEDNVIIMVVKKETLNQFQSGKIFTPIEKKFSQDTNLDDSTMSSPTQFGNFAVTGVTLGTPVYNSNGEITHFERTVNVSYAKPNATTASVTYTITGSTGDLGDEQNYYKFPSDIEYFQVITGITVTDFLSLENFTNQISNRTFYSYMSVIHDVFFDAGLGADSFNSTFLEYDPVSGAIFPPGTQPFDTFTPLRWQCLEDSYDFGLVFLVRGVDPYSSRQKCSYDLSVLFGYSNYDEPGLTIEGQFKLNIPIQGAFKNVRHGITMTDSSSVDSYSNQYLFYPSYSFQPDSGMYNQYTTTATSYYIRGDMSDNVNCSGNAVDSNGALGLRINDNNWFSREFYANVGTLWSPPNVDVNGQISGCKTVYPNGSDINNTDAFNQPGQSPRRDRGYYRNEIIEGAAHMYLNASQYQPSRTALGFWVCEVGNITSMYCSYSYKSVSSSPSTYTINMSSSSRIVMRGDRLPTSSVEQINGTMSYALHANQYFTLFEVSDNGYAQSSGIGNGTPTTEVDVSNNPTLSGAGPTFSCEGLIPLGCYSADPETGAVIVLPPDDPCYTNNADEQLVRNGCYVLVQRPIVSLLLDVKLLAEWIARSKLGFAACRNIFGLIFTNYWVNGTLYMFPIKNSIKYTGPNDTPSNSPFPCVCPEVVFVDYDTNNIYYRSAPYKYPDGFIGKDSPINFGTSFPENKPNYRNLLFPTTIMDLGPRTKYTSDLILSDEYLGYTMDRLSTTSYQDTSDLLNQFIMSRLLSQSLIGMIVTQLVPALGAAGDPVRRMFSRGFNKVDGDYAQMVAINSQIGVFPYDEDEYLTPDPNAIPSAPNGYVYTNPSSSKFNVFGVFYQQNYELRDLLSPHRLLSTPTGATTNYCTYQNSPIFTQVVPFYQWYTIENRGRGNETPDPDSIFGDQRNDWWTPQPAGGPNVFFTSPYQGMDRLDSGFMQPVDNSIYGYHGGYLFNVNGGEISAYPATAGGVYATANVKFKPDYQITVDTYNGRIMTPSGPFYFYFGLNRGKSAFDRFLTKWIQGDTFEI